jgi:adenylate cyclase
VTFSVRALAYVRRMSVVWQMRLGMLVGLVLTNLAGAVVVYCLAALVVPLPVESTDEQALANLWVATALVPVLFLVGILRGWVILQPTALWVREGREPDDSERRRLLRTPRRMFVMQALLWGVAVVAFGLFNSFRDPGLGWVVALIVALAGVSTCSIAYLVTERVMRPLARRALAAGVPDRMRVRSVAMRTMVAWVLGTGISVLGLTLVGLTSIGEQGEVSVDQLAITMLVLGSIAFLVGGLSTFLAAKASSDPVRALRKSIAQVGRGDLSAEVQIYDGTEIGLLQAGFNDMVAGLREREQLRDLFGRHVGDDVARAALEGGVRLGGEARDIVVLFVDIIGSTSMAANRPPEEVVALLNRFFDVVIDTVHEYDGWINKFEGDAALAIWGAPVPLEGMETAALGAARVMGERLRRDVPELEAGIGVSGGRAVAGNVGASERYEYTVIGDPVNEAARLTGLAKTVPNHVVANAALLDAAPAEAGHWQLLEPVVVRGRSEPTRIATPAG